MGEDREIRPTPRDYEGILFVPQRLPTVSFQRIGVLKKGEEPKLDARAAARCPQGSVIYVREGKPEDAAR
jgi:hypothetical protein